MKLLCTADWHVGSGREFGYGDTGPGSRLHDQEQVLERIVDVAIEENVDAVLFAGDLWHRPRPAPWEIAAVQRPLSKLNGEIPFFAINGNRHDFVNAELEMALEVAGLGWQVSRRPEVIRWPEVSIATLPWTPPARLVAARGGGDRDVVHADVAELLLDTARGLRADCPSHVPAVLLAHWSISGASTPSGIETDQFREPVLDLHGVAELGFDAVVLGHVHRAQVLWRGPDVFYVGSPAIVNFGEVEPPNVEPGSWHGVSILDVESSLVRHRHVPIADRPFVTVDVDLTTERHEEIGLSETETVLAAAATHELGEAVIRLRYTASGEQAKRIDHEAIRRALLEAGVHRIYAIQAEIIREDRARVAGVDESMDELEALQMYVSAQGMRHEMAEQVGERTARYLQELRT